MNLCQKCNKNPINPFFCRECQSILPLKALPNYFESLGMEPIFDVDKDHIETQYESFMMDVHPDFFFLEEGVEKTLGLKYSSYLKEARDTLFTPFERSMHLLQIFFNKQPTENELMPSQDFLIEVFDLQEKIESGTAEEESNFHILSRISKVLEELNSLFIKLPDNFNEEKYQDIVELVGQLKFLQNLKEKIECL